MDDDDDGGGGDDDGGSICYFSGATLVWVNLYVRSFEKIDDVKV